MFTENDIVKEVPPADGASVRHYVLLMAGGSGLRAGGGVPKQMRPLNGVPMLVYSIRAFRKENVSSKIILVLNDSCLDDWKRIQMEFPETEGVEVCSGGVDRLGSVKNGLKYIRETYDAPGNVFVSVHDAARPMVDVELIRRGLETASRNGTAVPVVPEVNSLRECVQGHWQSADRANFRVVQTPQIFRFDILEEGYAAEMRPEFTDDASVCEAAGYKIALYDGSPENFKVTEPLDLVMAEAVLKAKADI